MVCVGPGPITVLTPSAPLQCVKSSIAHVLCATTSLSGNEGCLLFEHDPEATQPPPLVTGVLSTLPAVMDTYPVVQQILALLPLQKLLMAVPGLPLVPRCPAGGGSGEREPGTEEPPPIGGELALCSLPSCPRNLES